MEIENMNDLLIPVEYLIFFAAVLIAVLCAGFLIGRLCGRAAAEKDSGDRIKSARKDTLRRSRAVIGGKCAEQLAPYLPGFPADASEIRFIGAPVDYIAFTGASREEITEVVFIEVKTGKSALNKNERGLKNAIENKRVRWIEYRAP